MYLHIGGEKIISLKEIVAVLHARALEEGEDGPIFLQHAKASGRLVYTGNEQPLSYVITTDAVYASPLSAATLKRRAENPQSLATE